MVNKREAQSELDFEMLRPGWPPCSSCKRRLHSLPAITYLCLSLAGSGVPNSWARQCDADALDLHYNPLVAYGLIFAITRVRGE